jgi:hypothetical protein
MQHNMYKHVAARSYELLNATCSAHDAPRYPCGYTQRAATRCLQCPYILQAAYSFVTAASLQRRLQILLPLTILTPPPLPAQTWLRRRAYHRVRCTVARSRIPSDRGTKMYSLRSCHMRMSTRITCIRSGPTHASAPGRSSHGSSSARAAPCSGRALAVGAHHKGSSGPLDFLSRARPWASRLAEPLSALRCGLGHVLSQRHEGT